MYEEIYGLENLENFKGIETYFVNNINLFQKIFDAFNAHEEPVPGD